MIRETFAVGMLQCNCTVLGDELSREAIVIDPGDEVTRIVSILARHELTLKKIVVTHAHIDHIAGAVSLKRLTGAPIFYSKDDLALVAILDQQAALFGMPVPESAPPDHSPEDLEPIKVQGIEATVLHTPGHSLGSLCLYLPDESLLLAGDTLFAGGIGRTDFPGGNARQLMASIHDRLLTLPPETLVVPGHGPATTIGREALTNPFLT